jgi:hypothetical protein
MCENHKKKLSQQCRKRKKFAVKGGTVHSYHSYEMVIKQDKREVWSVTEVTVNIS